MRGKMNLHKQHKISLFGPNGVCFPEVKQYYQNSKGYRDYSSHSLHSYILGMSTCSYLEGFQAPPPPPRPTASSIKAITFSNFH